MADWEPVAAHHRENIVLHIASPGKGQNSKLKIPIYWMHIAFIQSNIKCVGNNADRFWFLLHP
jgi:hypothetical protein